MRAKENNPDIVPGKLKEFTSKKSQKVITGNQQESRKEWLLWMMERGSQKSSNVTGRQFWQHNNKPIEWWSSDVIDQKADYIHNNPVAAGFVVEPWDWKYSSAKDYSGGKGVLEMDFI
jgi:hypothetical protein